ncbi:MAG: response regulator [Parcubacteria group bacterium]|jgi:DNA-binding NtrC family response regulator
MGSDKNTILVADDDSYNRDFFNSLFETMFPDYNLEIYSTGREIENRFRERGFDSVKLVVLDEVMDPGLRGTDLIKKYSKLASKSGCKMILHTGEGAELGELAIKNGAFGYLLKSTDFGKMERMLRDALSD